MWKGKTPVGGRKKIRGGQKKKTDGKGTTKAYPRFAIHESAFVTALFRHAVSKFGLFMVPAQASALVVDVSKCLHFSASTHADAELTEHPQDLVCTDLVQKYLEKLEGDDIQCSGKLF